MMDAKLVTLGLTAVALIGAMGLIFNIRSASDELSEDGTTISLEEACSVVFTIENTETQEAKDTGLIEMARSVLEICGTIKSEDATWETKIAGTDCNGDNMSFEDLFQVYEGVQDLINSYGEGEHSRPDWAEHALDTYCGGTGTIDVSNRRLLETHGGVNFIKMMRHLPTEDLVDEETGMRGSIDENGRRLVTHEPTGVVHYKHDETGRKHYYHEESRKLLTRRSTEVDADGRQLWGAAVKWVVKTVVKIVAAVVCAAANFFSQGDFCGQIKKFIEGVAGGLTQCVHGWDDAFTDALLSWSVAPIKTWWNKVMTCVETRIMRDYRTGIYVRNEETGTSYTGGKYRKYASLKEANGIDNKPQGGNGRRDKERILDPSCSFQAGHTATTPPTKCTTANGKLHMNWNPTASGSTDPTSITTRTYRSNCPGSSSWYDNRYGYCYRYWRGYCGWHWWVQRVCRKTCAQHRGTCRTTSTTKTVLGSTMGNDGCLSPNQLSVRKWSMKHLAHYANVLSVDRAGQPKTKAYGEVGCASSWYEKHRVKWDFMVDGAKYSLPIIEPCSAQSGLDFDMIMCDNGMVDDSRLNINRDDPRYGDALQMLGWGNLVFHGLCGNDMGGPLDTGPMSFMFLYLLAELDKSHQSPSSWRIPGVNGGNKYTRTHLHNDMDLFFHTMDDYNTYPSPGAKSSGGTVKRFGEYTEGWMQNMNRIDAQAGSYMNVIPVFVKRAIGVCIPNCPGIANTFGLCDDYDNFLFGNLKNLLNDNVQGFGDIMGNYNAYPIGNNRVGYNFRGCLKLIEGAVRFANAFVVQSDGVANDLFLVGHDRPPLDSTCDIQYHSRWHWRASGVMRAFMEMTQIIRSNPTTPYRGKGTH